MRLHPLAALLICHSLLSYSAIFGISMPAQYISRSASHAGGWLPSDPRYIKIYVDRLTQKAEKFPNRTLVPPVKAFFHLIMTDATLFQDANRMITQVPRHLVENPTGGPRLKSIRHMCNLINTAVLEPPPYNHYGLVAFPINAILEWSMGTPAGRSFLLSKMVNEALGEILNYWAKFLNSPSSLIAFKDPSEGGGGWMTPNATARLNMDNYKQPNPTALAWGYTSWNSWFIREFKDGMRPIAEPKNKKIVVSACESTPFKLERDVRLRSNFWLKGQAYSLAFMLGNEQRARPFVGGDVYQAFLSAFEYHRWHAPIDGTIKEALVIPGSYYAQSPAVGFDAAGPDMSQAFITNVAARAVIIIEAEDSVIGSMALVAVGMAEVSSNILTVTPGTRVTKGDQLGYFQFGGSTHCLVFKKGVIEKWFPPVMSGSDAKLVKLHERLALVADKRIK